MWAPKGSSSFIAMGKNYSRTTLNIKICFMNMSLVFNKYVAAGRKVEQPSVK